MNIRYDKTYYYFHIDWKLLIARVARVTRNVATLLTTDVTTYAPTAAYAAAFANAEINVTANQISRDYTLACDTCSIPRRPS